MRWTYRTQWNFPNSRMECLFFGHSKVVAGGLSVEKEGRKEGAGGCCGHRLTPGPTYLISTDRC